MGLPKKLKMQALKEMTYQEIFDVILCLERNEYNNAPLEVREAVYQAWMDTEDVGFLNPETLDEIERKLNLNKKHWEKNQSTSKTTENEKFIRDFWQQRHNGPVTKDNEVEAEKSMEL